MFAPSSCRRGRALNPGAKRRSMAHWHPSFPPCTSSLLAQQCWLRTCSPRTQEAFVVVSPCGQSAKPTGNTLHHIQDCGGSTALHARAVVVSSRWTCNSRCIRSEGAPPPLGPKKSRLSAVFDEQDPLHSLLFTFFSTSLHFISSSVFCQLHSFHLRFKSHIHSSPTPSLSISLPSIPCIHNNSSTKNHRLQHGLPADLAPRLCGPRLRQPGHLGQGSRLS